MGNKKTFKPVAGLPQAARPMTEAEIEAERLRISQQKLGAVTEGCIFNAVRSVTFATETVSATGCPRSTASVSPEALVDYCLAVGKEYVRKMYGVEFKPKGEAQKKEKEA